VNPPDLLVIVPSRGRPHAVEQLAQAWADTGATAKPLICVDLDDPGLGQYMDACEEYGVELLVAPLRRPEATLNEVACRYSGSWAAIGYCRDDFAPAIEGWDRWLLAELERLGGGTVCSKALFPQSHLPSVAATSASVVASRGYLVTPEEWHAYVTAGRLS
jgi:hypothetical protein